MTVVEKAAYLKGLVEGLGIEPDSREGKLWGALGELLSDMAHEIEDLQATDMDHAEALDEMAEELSYLEDLVCDLDEPEDFDDEDCDGDCDSCGLCDEDDEDEDDEEPEYDGVIYDVTCPVCGEEISFDEETLDKGSIECPSCGETLEFDLSDEEDEDKD
ncbi:MAG TPA: hypothetical protein IAC00_07175 [Candidatus Limivicinus faecipullorum]|nr:hypothetical protein [Candidatus Limivicinus faecipullorum]